MKNLPETVDEELLEIFFESTKKQGGGPVKSVKILSDKKAAFVEFCERKSVETVLKKKPIKYGKTELDIKPFKSLLIRGSEKVNMVDLKGLSVSDEFTDGLVKRQLESLLVPEYGPELASLIKVGTRVVRGRDWNYVNSDGGPGGQGTVTAIDGDSRDKTLTIRWDTEGEYTGYPMGSGGYAVKLAP